MLKIVSTSLFAVCLLVSGLAQADHHEGMHKPAPKTMNKQAAKKSKAAAKAKRKADKAATKAKAKAEATSEEADNMNEQIEKADMEEGNMEDME